MKFAAISASSSGDNTVVAAVPNRRIKVLNYVAIAASDVSAKWKSGSTDISGAMAFAANGGVAPVGGPNTPVGMVPLFQTEQGEALVLNLSGAISVAGHLAYVLGD